MYNVELGHRHSKPPTTLEKYSRDIIKKLLPPRVSGDIDNAAHGVSGSARNLFVYDNYDACFYRHIIEMVGGSRVPPMYPATSSCLFRSTVFIVACQEGTLPLFAHVMFTTKPYHRKRFRVVGMVRFTVFVSALLTGFTSDGAFSQRIVDKCSGSIFLRVPFSACTLIGEGTGFPVRGFRASPFVVDDGLPGGWIVVATSYIFFSAIFAFV